MQTGIYEIVCLQNCRRYIGSATSFSNRWARHKYQLRSGVHHSSYLQRAWNKHGENAFLFNVLIKCHKDDLILYEQIAIDALLPEFNCCRVAGNTAGRITSQETKAKLSAAITGIRRSEDTRQLMSFAAKGRHRAPLSQETKTKISLSLFGKPQPRSQEHSRRTWSCQAIV